MNTILIVGRSFHTLKKYLAEHGHECVTLADIRLVKNPDKRLKRRVVCDFSSDEAMYRSIDEATKKYKISGVMVVYENYVLPASKIASYLKLPGLPVEAAEACTDKFLMREKFSTARVKISPAYRVVKNEEEILAFADTHQFPLILKPANLAKSLLVTKCHDKEELLDNYRKTIESIDAIYHKYAPDRKPKLLIEEFMVGSIHSVDAFVDIDGEPQVLDQVVDYQTGYDVGYDDNFHYSRLLPSRLSGTQIKAIRETAAVGCKALGMKSSPAHVEIILTEDGPRIVEIGARNGGYRERMHGLANGIDIIGGALALALGEQPDITARRNDACAVLELFPKTAGVFKSLSGEEELRKLPSLVYCDIKPGAGSYVGKSSDGYKMTAVIMLHHNDSAKLRDDLAFVNKNVAVVTS